MTTVNMHRKFREVWNVVFEMCERTDKQTYRHADRNTSRPYWGKVWGKVIIVNGILCRYGEVYTWKNVRCSVNNIIVGKLWIEHVSLFSCVLLTSIDFPSCSGIFVLYAAADRKVE